MKSILIILLLLIVPATAFADNDWKFYVFGVDLDRLKDMSWTTVAIGIIASVAIHEAAHIAYLKLNKKDYHIERRGFRPIIYSSGLNNRESRWFSRAGFTAQLIIGSLLPRDSGFAAGWLGAANYQLTWYGTDPIGDFRNIDQHGGDGEKEYQAFSLWVNLLGDRKVTRIETWR